MKTGLSFSEAVKAAMDGKKIRRACWHKSRAIIFYRGLLQNIDAPRTVDMIAKEILADDWEIVPDPLKTMGFMDAWAEAKKGKKIARLEWSKDTCAKLVQDCGFLKLRRCDLKGVHLYNVVEIIKENIDATDWIVVEEEVSHG